MNIVNLRGQHLDHNWIEPVQVFIAGQSSQGIIVCDFFRLVSQFGLGVNVLATTSVSLWFISSQSVPAQANHRLPSHQDKNSGVCGMNIHF